VNLGHLASGGIWSTMLWLLPAKEGNAMAQKRKPLAVVEDRIEVAASPEVLWTCFIDLSRWPNWFPALVEAEWIAGTPWTVGAQFRQTVRFGFPLGRVTGVATIIEVSASPFVVWEDRVAGIQVVYRAGRC